MCLQARLACGELARPFLDALLQQFVCLLQRLLSAPAVIDAFDDPQCVEYLAIPAAYRTDIDPYPDRFTGFSNKAFFKLEVRSLSYSRGATLPCALLEIIWVYDVEIGESGQFLRPVSEHVRQRRVYLAEPPIKIGGGHSKWALLKHPPKPLLALAKRTFRALLV